MAARLVVGEAARWRRGREILSHGRAARGTGGGGRGGARDLLARAGGAEVLGAGGAREAGGGEVAQRSRERGGVEGGSLAASLQFPRARE